jgi:hypothetical protein
MIIPLKSALPAIVPMPNEKPSASLRTNKANNVVNNSGNELDMALMVPPRTPSDKFRPMYSDAVSNPSHARQMNKQQKKMINSGIKMPIHGVSKRDISGSLRSLK